MRFADSHKINGRKMMYQLSAVTFNSAAAAAAADRRVTDCVCVNGLEETNTFLYCIYMTNGILTWEDPVGFAAVFRAAGFAGRVRCPPPRGRHDNLCAQPLASL